MRSTCSSWAKITNTKEKINLDKFKNISSEPLSYVENLNHVYNLLSFNRLCGLTKVHSVKNPILV